MKAGITSEMRGIKRLLEQGARAALVVGRFDTAEEARDLEARLCGTAHIFETMRASKKAELLVDHRYDFAEAKSVLERIAKDGGLEPRESCLDLDHFYFNGSALSPDSLQVPSDDSDNVCGGLCIGMVGPLVIFEQKGINYVVSLKEWESHMVELYRDELIHSYAFEPMQMSLL